MRRALARGLTPGRDIAVVGFDDSQLARRVQPAMSSLAQPLTRTAELIWQALLPQLRGQAAEPTQVIVPPTLVVRESSSFYLAPPPGGP
ncbi:MAG: substrate-binding domain-containing protein [Bifidobacteriaceae bacterium]|jgi:LacI family transcriptional regulator|nr:substrate-binding domain-containing protein [Bifidobacteriaceae bacterium]